MVIRLVHISKIKKIDLIKIDTEGHEFNVIKGMGNLLKKTNLILFEYHYDNSLIRGYDFIDEKHYLFNSIIEGNFFNNKTNEIIIGDSFASSINVKVGDQIKLAIPKSDKTILGSIPRFKTLKIKGIFDFGMY